MGCMEAFSSVHRTEKGQELGGCRETVRMYSNSGELSGLDVWQALFYVLYVCRLI